MQMFSTGSNVHEMSKKFWGTNKKKTQKKPQNNLMLSAEIFKQHAKPYSFVGLAA